MKKLFIAVLIALAVLTLGTAALAADDTGMWEYQATDSGVTLTKYNGDHTDVYIPNKIEIGGEKLDVISIGSKLFDGILINSATLGEGITTIGDSAFENQTELVCIVTPESLTTIGDNAFSGCTSFNSVILYDGVTSIGENAFLNCSRLTIYCNENTAGHNYAVTNSISYTILNPNAKIKIVTVDGVKYYIVNGEAMAVSYESYYATDVVIPATVEGYPVVELKDIFSDYGQPASVILPSSLKIIDDSVFEFGTIILVYENSYAHKYVKEKKLLYHTVDKNEVPERYTEKGFTYMIINDEAIAISFEFWLYYEEMGTYSVTVPASVNGYPVTELLGTFKYFDIESIVTLPEGLKKIGDFSFFNACYLVEIEIPDSVTSIGDYAFSGAMDDEEYLTIPDSVTSIGKCAFSGCALTSVTIPYGATSIGDGAFSGCSLTSITIPDSVTSIGDSAFSECLLTSITIPDSVTSIGDSVFSRCSLTDITIPNSVTSIGNKAFYLCDSLTSITIPDSVTSIGDSAFSGCSLTDMTIPNSVTILGDSVFSSCNRLSSVTIPESVTHIGNSAFLYCNKLTKINVSKENEYYTSFEGVLFNKDKTTLIKYPSDKMTSNYTVPSNVSVICDEAFYNCDKLMSVTMPDSVTIIGNYAFNLCDHLEKITLPEGLKSIEKFAFKNCPNLMNIDIPQSVISISDNAFSQNILFGVLQDTYAHKFAIENDLLFVVLVENKSYDIYKDGGVAYYILNNEAVAFDCYSSNSSMTIPAVINGYPVKEMKRTFSECYNLISITIPDTVTHIGKNTFTGCYNLLNIKIPESVTYIDKSAFDERNVLFVSENSYAHTFAKDNAITYYVIGEDENIPTYKVNGVTYSIINREAIATSFDQSTRNVIIPATVEGYPVTELIGTFKECRELSSVQLPDSLKKIGDYTFRSCEYLYGITIPDSVTYIGKHAFDGCDLYAITIPNSVTYIGEYALAGSECLEDVHLPSNLTYISEGLFSYSFNLTQIDIPESVTYIGNNAFNATSLTQITIPDNVTYIGDKAFSGCYLFWDVIIPDGVTYIGDGAFSWCEMSNITIPDSVTHIGDYAFWGCKYLVDVTIPSNITNIGEGVFYNCSQLESITIPDSVTSIGENAFNGTAIKTVTIPTSVTSMGASTFTDTTIIYVYENSYAHKFVVENNLLYFVIRTTSNPEISYGTGITGSVTYTDGSVASGETVEILYDDGTVKESVRTDAEGKYEFTYAEVGRYTIRVTDSDGNTASEIVSVKRMNVFDVYLAGETDLVLKKGYNVSGTVTPDTAKVTISDTNGNTIKSVDITDGAFSFDNIARGSYIVKAENENGSAMAEIYVSNEDVTGISLEIQAKSATITGDVKIENRDGTFTAKIWVNIDLIDENGNVIARTTTNEEGKYTFECVPAGSYNIVALVNEMRPDIIGGFDKSHELKGYGHIDVTEFITYTVDTIILREDKVNLTSVSGKVTANGTTQDCRVILTNENGDQIAVFVTDKNGFYSFVNIPDGMYAITAITKADGMGFTVITIKDGVVYGDTDIKVAKADKISKREPTLLAIPNCNTKEEALIYKEAVLAEKAFYDSLSEKERNQLSAEWIEKLLKLVDLIFESTIDATEGVVVENVESVIPADETEEIIEFTLNVTETESYDAGEDGIGTEKEYETEKIKDKKGKDKKIAKYYDITFSKDGRNISNIRKQTETNGKLRITMEIPEEHRGHKHYSFIHMHNGEAVTLVDLDNDPDTVTFEIDKFSTFALAYSDVELLGELAETKITYNDETGKISVSATEQGKLYVATYDGTKLTEVKAYEITANAELFELEFTESQKAFIFDADIIPLCEAFSL